MNPSKLMVGGMYQLGRDYNLLVSETKSGKQFIVQTIRAPLAIEFRKTVRRDEKDYYEFFIRRTLAVNRGLIGHVIRVEKGKLTTDDFFNDLSPLPYA